MAIDTIQRGIKVKNYKCFGELPQGFSEIKPINVIIGKNNSGKSSLIDLVEYVFSEQSSSKPNNILENGMALVEVRLTKEEKDRIIEKYSKHSKQNVEEVKMKWKGENNSNYFDGTISFHMRPDKIWEFYNCPNELEIFQSMSREEVDGFTKRSNFFRISADRDIKAEYWKENPKLKPDGEDATSIIRRHLHVEGLDQDLIYFDLLEGLNKIVEPDSRFTNITLKLRNESVEKSMGEIYLKDENNTWIKLSKMGSGIKTILLVLLNLHIEGRNNDYYKSVFGFEELENNLHPSLQRKLFLYILDYSRSNNCIFFITTHSPIAVDFFMKESLAQVIHVQRNSQFSIATKINDSIGHRSVIKDLELRASDLLMANGIVWVEGPSDVVYWELYLELFFKHSGQSVDRLGYTIQPLSTAVWKHTGFEEVEWDSETRDNLISLADLNHNHLIIIDEDSDYENLLPSEYEKFENGTGRNKAKLINASMKFNNYNESELESNYGSTSNGQYYFCINRITAESDLAFFVQNKGRKFKKYFEGNPDKRSFQKKRKGTFSAKSKMSLAQEIIKFAKDEKVTLEDFAPIDSSLLRKVEGVFITIKSWN